MTTWLCSVLNTRSMYYKNLTACDLEVFKSTGKTFIRYKIWPNNKKCFSFQYSKAHFKIGY